MNSSYWAKITQQRLSRRRALATTGATAFGAALLAACGGGGDDGGSEESSGLVSKPVDTTKSAKKGGIFKDGTRTDATTFDPYTLASSEPRRPIIWSRLTQTKPGILSPSTGEVEGDAAASWEVSADKLTVTFKIRPNVKFDPRPPTSGRNLDSSDVLYSWGRLQQIGARRQDYASVASVTAPDAQTVVMKLKAPDADLFSLLAATASGNFHIMPKETEGGYDIKQEDRGSGPYYISEYRPSQGITYKRNPGYYNQNVAFVDTFESPVLSEYASALSQFRAGQVYRFPEDGLRLEDLLPTKRDIPEMIMVETDISTATATAMYGFKDVPGSQFRDERVRQAYSVAIDRNLWIDAFHNVSELESQGLPVSTAWNSCIVCQDAGWWLDPQGKDFGENAKYYKFDPAMAKQLLSAAGYASGFDTNGHFITTGQYGLDYQKQIETQVGMVGEVGIRIKMVPHSFTAEWGPDYRDAKGNFDGIGWLNISGIVDAGVIQAFFGSTGSLFKGFTPDGTSTFKGDPKIDDLAMQLKQEFDRPKRFQLAYELQRIIGKTQYTTRFPGGAAGFNLGWPAIGNFGVYRGGTGGSIKAGPDTFYWIDETKAPIKKA